MFVAELKTKNIAGQIKSADLATPVAKYLIGPRHTAGDLVGVVGFLTFAEDLGLLRKKHCRAHHADSLDQRVALGDTIDSRSLRR